MRIDPLPAAAAAAPYLSLRWTGSGVQCSGSSQAWLGERPAGQTAGHGVFAAWQWDGEELRVSNDEFGIYPLFWACSDSEIRVSPSLAWVVGGLAERAYDDDALAVYLRLGHFLANDSPFAAVRVLGPGGSLRWRQGRLLAHEEAALPGGAACGLGFDGLVDAYIDLFAQAVRRRQPQGEFALPLSGGRDSRHLLFELQRQGFEAAECATVRYRPLLGDEDVQIAARLCTELGIRHHELAYPASFFDACREDIQRANYCGGGHGWVLPVADYLAPRYTTVYDGLGGDVLSAGLLQDEDKRQLFASGRLEKLALLLLNESGREAGLQRVLGGGLRQRLGLDRALQRMLVELRRHQATANPLMSYLFWNRTRRCIAAIPYGIYSRIPRVHCPYLDRDLFALLSAVEAPVAQARSLHDSAISRAYPQYAHIPYAQRQGRPARQREQAAYYRRARGQLQRYLRQRGGWRSAKLNLPFLYGKLFSDFVRGADTPPWYMRTAVELLELDGLASSGMN